MATVELGTLLVRLKGDISQLEASMAGGKSQVQNFEKQSADSASHVSGHWARTAAEVAIALALMLRAFSAASSSAQDLLNASAQTGESVEAMSRLEFAAKSVGATLGDVTNATKGWQQALSDLRSGEVTDATRAIEDLGVSFQDSSGRFRSFSEALPDIADKIKLLPDGFEKSRIGSALLRDDTGKLLTLLNQGSSSIQALNDRQKELGTTMDRDGAQQAAKYQVAVGELKDAWDKLGGTLAYLAAGPLSAVVNFFARGVSDTKDFLDERALRAWRSAWEENSVAIQKVGDQIAINEERQRFFLSQPMTPENVDDVNKIGDALDNLRAKLAGLIKLQEFFNDQRNQISLSADVKPLEVPFPTDALKGWFDIKKVIQTDLDDIQDRLKGMPIVLKDGFDFDTNPFERAMDRIQNAVDNGVISQAQASRLFRENKRQEQQAVLDTATVISNSLTTVFAKSKLAAAASAAINTAVGITKALALEGPLGWIQAAAIAAAGVAQIATIMSASATGSSGSPSVSGGGSSDGSSSSGSTDAAPQPRTLFIEGISGGGMFSPAAVRDLIERINVEVKDGAVLVVQ